jgi:hypothetical protein
MTEYITKEQAADIATIVTNGEGIDGEINLTLAEFRRAINLAFEQRLEVVGYTNSTSISKGKDSSIYRGGGVVVTVDKSWPDPVALYALKGDSK